MGIVAPVNGEAKTFFPKSSNSCINSVQYLLMDFALNNRYKLTPMWI